MSKLSLRTLPQSRQRKRKLCICCSMLLSRTLWTTNNLLLNRARPLMRCSQISTNFRTIFRLLNSFKRWFHNWEVLCQSKSMKAKMKLRLMPVSPSCKATYNLLREQSKTESRSAWKECFSEPQEDKHSPISDISFRMESAKSLILLSSSLWVNQRIEFRESVTLSWARDLRFQI